MERFIVYVSVAVVCFSGACWADEVTSPGHRVYGALMNPREHPDDLRRYVKPPSWETFDNRTQFVALRGFPIETGRLVRFNEEIDKYTTTFGLGNVVWPHYPTIFAENLSELAEAIKARGLFLFDIWGYVPGSGVTGDWLQYRPDRKAFAMLESVLGDRWLGMDVGEQDGRYIGGYASQMAGISNDRVAQYLNFQRHFERMGDDLGNRLSVLVSLNFGHYLLKEGTYATIGAETAQALPNSQVYYAFIRGAGKQYGVPWFGNASVFNRWGYKAYGTPGPDHSPTKGSSLNLLKRLMYSHILYDCVFVGFEAGWFDGEALSPVGRVQQAAQQWVRANGQPGTMMTPVALLMDFFAGWTFPRHLYSGQIYRVWGNVPYGPGDYLTEGVLDMLYPGYQDSSYFHDESGFLSPTPYGDGADCLLSDAPMWLLERYPLVIVAGELAGGAEVADTLAAYVRGGGHLVVTSGNLRKMTSAFPCIHVGTTPHTVAADVPIFVGDRAVQEDCAWALLPIDVPPEARILARCGEYVAAAEVAIGKGRVTVLASEFGVPEKSVLSTLAACANDTPLPKPFPLLKHVRAIADAALREQTLFDAGDGLGLIVCRKAPCEYTLGVFNNGLSPKAFKIASHCGPIESVVELALDQSEKGAIGYLPEGSENAQLGDSGEAEIAGGDVRVFAVRVHEENVAEIAHVKPGAAPKGRLLPLTGSRMLKEEILMRPTFFAHFDGVVLEWRYLHMRDIAALKDEAGWIARQGLRVIVDLSSGIDLFPCIRLLDNDDEEYQRSLHMIDDVLEKMEAFGARELVLSLHRMPENNFAPEQANASFVATVREVCARASSRSISVLLRTSTKAVSSLGEALNFLDEVSAPNLRLAPSTALLLHQKTSLEPLRERLDGRIGLWLIAAPDYDVAGTLWTAQAPLVGYLDLAALKPLLAFASDAPMALDGVYANPDEEYLDAQALSTVLR